MASKPESSPCSGNSMEETYLLAMRCPVYRRRESIPGFRTELENLAGDGKGKAQADEPRGRKYRCAGAGADCSVVVLKRGNARGAKGAGHPHRDRKGQRATGGTRWCRWKAVAFNGWHEPCESRGSSTVLGAPRGEIPRGDSAMEPWHTPPDQAEVDEFWAVYKKGYTRSTVSGSQLLRSLICSIR